MGIDRIMQNALKTNWTRTDDFVFTFYNKRDINIQGSDMSIQDIYDMSVINIDLPQLGSDVESVMTAGEYRIYNAKFQPFTFSVTFRDFGSLSLRNYFSAIWMDAQRGYYDDVKSSISISIGGKIVFASEDCLINAVSQVQLDNNNSQIAEFTVEFSSPYYTNNDIKNFGSDNYYKAQSKLDTGSDTGSSIFSGKDDVSNGIKSLRDIVSTVKTWF